MNITIKSATLDDSKLIFAFIKAMGDYEKMADEVKNSPEMIKHWVFEKHCAEVIIAYADNIPAGFSLYFYNYSTFVGKPGLYLEDIFVKPEYRGKGIGNALFKKLASIAVENKCERFEWCCLDWNKPSIDFYLSKGAKPMDKWTTYRLSGKSLIDASK